MASRNSIAALWRPLRPSLLLQIAPSLVVWLEGELVVRLADTPTVGGILGLVIAVAFRIARCLNRSRMRRAADRLPARILQRFARACTG